jgi:hypothetical protein
MDKGIFAKEFPPQALELFSIAPRLIELIIGYFHFPSSG